MCIFAYVYYYVKDKLSEHPALMTMMVLEEYREGVGQFNEFSMYRGRAKRNSFVSVWLVVVGVLLLPSIAPHGDDDGGWMADVDG